MQILKNDPVLLKRKIRKCLLITLFLQLGCIHHHLCWRPGRSPYIHSLDQHSANNSVNSVPAIYSGIFQGNSHLSNITFTAWATLNCGRKFTLFLSCITEQNCWKNKINSVFQWYKDKEPESPELLYHCQFYWWCL